MTSAEAQTLFANIPRERWPAAVQTLIVGTLAETEQLRAINVALQAKLDQVVKGTLALALEFKAWRESGGATSVVDDLPAGEVESAADVALEQVASAPVPTVDSNGNPLTPEQAAIEAQMNEAIAAQQAEKVGAPAPRAPQRQQPGRGARRPQPGQPPRQPLQSVPAKEPSQEDLEAQMDASIAAMGKGEGQ